MTGSGEPPDAEPARSQPAVARRLLAQLRPHRWRLAAVLGTAIGGVAAGTLAAPRVLGYATDLIFAGAVGGSLPAGATQAEALEGLRAEGRDDLAEVYATVDIVPGQGVDFARLGLVLLGLLGLYLAAFACTLVAERLTAVVVARVVFDLRERVAAKLTRLPLSYFDRRSRGELQSRLTNDVDNVQKALQQGMAQLVTKTFAVLGVLVLMFVVSPLLAVIVLATLPVAGLIAAPITRRARSRFTERWNATGELNAHVEQVYAAHSLVAAFGRREYVERTFDEHNEKVFRAARRGQVASEAVEPAMSMVANLNYILIAVVGALRVIGGSVSIGEVQAFLHYSGHFGHNAGMLAGIIGQLQSGLASAERIFDLLDAQEEPPDPEGAAVPEPVRGRVCFERVGFCYTPDTPVIQDLSFTVEPGQTVAIVGATGAGKTTLANLLLRFYQLDSGRILVDGTDIATLPRDSVRRLTGVVLQDSWLFEGTVAENIAYGRPLASREQVVAAARATRVDHLIRTLPDGYDTVLDESTGISAGERQLIMAARALLSDPAILILDEATSSVDARTEVLVQRAMTSLLAGRTSFVIAHRLSTIREADLILLLDSGRVVEHGRHAELLDADGG
ncbi:ABC transporter ATP-binding protein [Amycolatopsis aidingensis]|uniref:ABC transporter ATP-binding protein n=1 Tax=Amycolatopsis aidingensis TaxID=2842453 RepID=UPI001C0CF1D6|nr:ABC transporter ATP-binding protein [Amycolatopsis aidingensis]